MLFLINGWSGATPDLTSPYGAHNFSLDTNTRQLDGIHLRHVTKKLSFGQALANCYVNVLF